VKWCLGFGILLFSTGCARPNQESLTPENRDTASAQAPVITLERTACFGSCPVYRLSVDAEGAVNFDGRAHVRHLGAASSHINPERVGALLSELEQAGYFSFASRYTPAEPVCGRYVTDSPSAITSIRIDGRTKRIEHDYGCGAAPGALIVLERRIDEVLGSGQWTGR
jgi:hypothetical protein